MVRSLESMEHRGSISLPCAALVLIICLGAFGTWGLLRRWRGLMELQLRLDRCVGAKALQLRTVIRQADASNERMRWERRIAPAEAVAARDGGAAAKAAILAEFTLQEGFATAWKATQIQWLARDGCGASGDRALPLPGLEWSRKPADEWGPQPFEWSRSEFRISAFHSPRAAGARVRHFEARGEGDVTHGKTDGWRALWARPG